MHTTHKIAQQGNNN